jgi:hypothetical protein
MRREIENLNEQIVEQFEEGEAGLGQQDHQLLAKPLAHVLGLDLDHKSQWLESISLARIWFVNQHEVESPSLRHQREFMASWMSDGISLRRSCFQPINALVSQTDGK